MTRYAAKAKVHILAGRVEVRCVGADAHMLAVAVEAVLRFSPPWRSRSGKLRDSIRRDGTTIHVGEGLDYAGIFERRSGGIADTINRITEDT